MMLSESRLPFHAGGWDQLPSSLGAPGRNEQDSLTPFYAALRRSPPSGWALRFLEISFADERGQRLDSLLLNLIDDLGESLVVAHNRVKRAEFTPHERSDIVEAVQKCSYLEQVRIQVGPGIEGTILRELLSGSSFLTVLRLSNVIERSEAYSMFENDWLIIFLIIFEALKVNKTLKKLDLSGTGFFKPGAQRILGGILELLQVNFVLEEIDLSGTLLACDSNSDRKVKAQLQKNAAMLRPQVDALKGHVSRIFELIRASF